MTVKEISEISNLSAGALALVKEDSTPSAYLDSLEKQQLFQDAVRFLAHKLAIDAGVKWACACVRELRAPDRKEPKDEPLEASEQWIKAPTDSTRRAARDAADKAKTRGPSYLVAMAVFMSGGSLSPPEAPETPPPPHTAQKMIAGSIVTAVVSHMPEKAAERYQRALAMGRALDQPGKG
ncbi:MAG: DUF6931 family protein [Bryobacteraceae bacterium]